MSDWDREQAEEYYRRVSSAAYALGQLESLLKHPEWKNREEQLGQVAADLRIALIGTATERVELEARRAADTDELMGRGEPRG